MSYMETALGIMVGLGLSAACGFRVFLPLLVLSVAAKTGHLALASGFVWVGSTPALIAFAAATLLEITAYYIPWVDHALDALSTPASVAAGTVATASLVTDLDPFLKWTLAVIAGGGLAGIVQGLTVFTRGLSAASTAGLANPLVATAELGGSLITSVLALLAPLLALVLVLTLIAFAGWKLVRLGRARRAVPNTPTAS